LRQVCALGQPFLVEGIGHLTDLGIGQMGA
jgi:hypothetical protein